MTKLSKYRYIFGFDAGTSSGAWSLIDTDNDRILVTGIYPNSETVKPLFVLKMKELKKSLELDKNNFAVVMEDVIPTNGQTTATMALKGSVMFMEGVFYALIPAFTNIFYVDPCINSKHQWGCWLAEFGLDKIKLSTEDMKGADRKQNSKKRKELSNSLTVAKVTEFYSKDVDKLCNPPKTNSKRKTTPKINVNIATSVLIAKFWSLHDVI